MRDFLADSWLKTIAQRLRDDFALTPMLATEMEFYVIGADALGDDAALLVRMAGLAEREGIPAHFPEKERALEQFEIALRPSADPVALARQTLRLQTAIIEDMRSIGIEASFAAKPFSERAGSGLHLHLHLEDAAGRNGFFRDEQDQYSPALRHALGGLLAALPASTHFFAPLPKSYARFAPEERAPTHLCWGPNNRTAALRLPPKPLDKKHIEHRVPGADADPAAALGAMLMGVHWGLSQKIEPPEAVHGEAHQAIYGLEKLPMSLAEAREVFARSSFAKDYPWPM